MRPTVIGAGTSPQEAPRPTVIGPGSAPAAAPLPPVLQPSPLPGERRLPAPVSREQLAARHPGVAPEVIEEMARVLEEDGLPADAPACARFGREAQQAHAQLAERLLAAADADVLRIVPRHLARLAALLEALVQALKAPSRGWWLRRPPLALFDELRPEIDELRTRLQDASPELESLHGRLVELQRAGRRLAVRIDALLRLAAEPDGPAGLPPLHERALSLGQTAAQLQQQELLLEVLRADCLRLGAIVGQAVLVQLPAWLASAAALPRGAELSDTRRFVLRDGLLGVLRQLPDPPSPSSQP